MAVICTDCGGMPKQIGNEVFYCPECDKIITEKRKEVLLQY